MPAKIIISYRRSDARATAGRIRDKLASRYGDSSVYMDVDNIPFGIDFREHINSALNAGDVLVAIIGSKWLGRARGRKSRLAEETDPVRVEIEAALRRKIAILPILVDGGEMPKASELPESMRDLAFYNAATVDDGRDFHQHMERVIRSIDLLLKQDSAAPRAPVAPRRRRLLGSGWGSVVRGRAAVVAAAMSLMAAIAGMAVWVAYRTPAPEPARVAANATSARPERANNESQRPSSTFIGGSVATAANWPWLVSIRKGQFLSCGGVAIAPRRVLTVGHCVKDARPDDIAVVRSDAGKTVQNRVTRIVVHPDYGSVGSPKNDLAILFTDNDLRPPFATLSSARDLDPSFGALGLIAGFDLMKQNLDRVVQVAVPVVGGKQCVDAYRDSFDDARQLCAGYPEGGNDACTGSSGFPLAILNSGGEKYQVGIVSWGRGCGEAGHYGVYTRVSAYVDWIRGFAPDLARPTAAR